jgi:hypothetical protein
VVKWGEAKDQPSKGVTKHTAHDCHVGFSNVAVYEIISDGNKGGLYLAILY